MHEVVLNGITSLKDSTVNKTHHEKAVQINYIQFGLSIQFCKDKQKKWHLAGSLHCNNIYEFR